MPLGFRILERCRKRKREKGKILRRREILGEEGEREEGFVERIEILVSGKEGRVGALKF